MVGHPLSLLVPQVGLDVLGELRGLEQFLVLFRTSATHSGKAKVPELIHDGPQRHRIQVADFILDHAVYHISKIGFRHGSARSALQENRLSSLNTALRVGQEVSKAPSALIVVVLDKVNDSGHVGTKLEPCSNGRSVRSSTCWVGYLKAVGVPGTTRVVGILAR